MSILTRTIRDRPGNEDEIRGMEEGNEDAVILEMPYRNMHQEFYTLSIL